MSTTASLRENLIRGGVTNDTIAVSSLLYSFNRMIDGSDYIPRNHVYALSTGFNLNV